MACGAHAAGAAILELDLGFDELLGLARVERVHQHGVFLGNEIAAHLAGAGELVVVGVQLLVQHQKARHLGVGHAGLGGQVGIDLGNAVRNQLQHLRLGGQVHVAAVGQALALGPVAHGLVVDVDEGADLVALVAEAHHLLDLRKELELVLDVVGREHGAAMELAHVLGAVDDAQVPVFIEHAGIAGVEVAVGIDHLGGGVRALVVLLEHRHAPDQHLAVVGDLELDPRCGLAHGVELDLAVLLDAHVGAGLGLAVKLLEVDADRAEEAEQVGADGAAGGVRHAQARQPQHIAQRPIDGDVAQAVEDAVRQRYGLAVQDVGTHAAGQVHAPGIEPAFRGCGIFHADRDRGQHALEHARGRKVISGADFAQIDVDGAGRLGTVDGEACHQPLRQREQVVAHPGRGQVGDDVVVGIEPIDLYPALCRCDEAGVGLAHALGLAGGARGVEDHRHIVGLVPGHHRIPGAGVGAVPFGAQGQELFGADQAGLVVVAQAAWVVVNDVRDAGQGFAHFQQLVHLLLVFGEDKSDLGVFHDEGHLGCHGILVQGNGNAAQTLYGNEAHVEVGAVVAHQREVLAPLQSEGRQAAGHVAHGFGGLLPAPGLPDAVFFFAQRRGRGALGGMLEQQLRERGLHSGS